MQQIEVSFPIGIKPNQIISVIETCLKKHANYECKVTFKEVEDDENVFYICSNDGPNAFYFIGMTASNIMSSYNRNSKK